MADDTISRLKDQVDCTTLFSRLWPQHSRDRGNSQCPFHQDSPERPSLELKTSHAYCFSCSQKWDAIDLWKEAHGCDTGQAIRDLCQAYGIENGNEAGKSNGKRTGKRETKKMGRQKEDSDENPFLSRWIHLEAQALPTSAVDYLERERALPGIVDELKSRSLLGYSEKFGDMGALCFPVTDFAGEKLLGLQYVPIGGGVKKFAVGTKHGEGYFRIGNGGDVTVVCEAVIDSLSVFLACRGELFLDCVSGLSVASPKKVKAIPGSPPVLFYDNDFAGLRATIQCAVEMGPGRVRWVDWGVADEVGDSKDVNDLAKRGRGGLILRMVKGAVGAKDDADLKAKLSGMLDRLDGLARNDQEKAQAKNLREAAGREAKKKKAEAEAEEEGWDASSRLNARHAMVMMGGKCCILTECYDYVLKRPDIQFWGVSDFHNWYANDLIEDGDKMVPVSKKWLRSKHRKSYHGIVFSPNGRVDGMYNLFRGFAVNPKPGRWTLFRNHILDVVAGGNAAVAEYILAWLAHLFQHPGGDRPGTAIVMRGRQGTGKGFFAHEIGKILGSHYIHVTQASHITGKFNSHMKDALLVFIDEALWAGDKQGESVLKALVTEDRIMIEHKGKDVISMKNHCSFIVASNSEWVVPTGMEERRFLVLDVLDRHIQDAKYFRAIADEMNNGGREAMLHDLLSVKDLDKFNLREIPGTAALGDQSVYSMGSLQKFWYEVLQRGHLDHEDDKWGTGEVQIGRFYSNYLRFCEDIGERYSVEKTMMKKQIEKMLAPHTIDLFRRRITIYSQKGEIEGTRVARWFRFPPLEECRKSFDSRMKGLIEWDSLEEEKS